MTRVWLVELPEPDVCCACGTPVRCGLRIDMGPDDDEMLVGWCDIDWQRELRSIRARGLYEPMLSQGLLKRAVDD